MRLRERDSTFSRFVVPCRGNAPTDTVSVVLGLINLRSRFRIVFCLCLDLAWIKLGV